MGSSRSTLENPGPRQPGLRSILRIRMDGCKDSAARSPSQRKPFLTISQANRLASSACFRVRLIANSSGSFSRQRQLARERFVLAWQRQISTVLHALRGTPKIGP